MHTSHNKGFIGFIFLLFIAGAAAYLIKDSQGMTYADRGMALVKYYFVDRGEEAISKARGAQKAMQEHQDKVQKMITE